MDIAEIAKLVRKQLKEEFPECLFSVRIKRFSMGRSMTIALMKAPFPAFAQDVDANGNKRLSDYAQLNQYQLRQEPGEDFVCNGVYLSGQAWRVMKRTDEVQAAHGRRSSFYFDAAIGRWNKPFKVI